MPSAIDVTSAEPPHCFTKLSFLGNSVLEAWQACSLAVDTSVISLLPVTGEMCPLTTPCGIFFVTDSAWRNDQLDPLPGCQSVKPQKQNFPRTLLLRVPNWQNLTQFSTMIDVLKLKSLIAKIHNDMKYTTFRHPT